MHYSFHFAVHDRFVNMNVLKRVSLPFRYELYFTDFGTPFCEWSPTLKKKAHKFTCGIYVRT